MCLTSMPSRRRLSTRFRGQMFQWLYSVRRVLLQSCYSTKSCIMENKWVILLTKSLWRKLQFRKWCIFVLFLFCFANLINYGIPSGLGAPFSLTTLLEQFSPARSRQVWTPGGGVLGLVFAGYVLLASENPCPIIVFSVVNYRPHLSHFWANM